MKYLIDVYAIIILNTLIMQSQNESQNDVKSSGKKKVSRKESLKTLANPCSVFASTQDLIISCGMNNTNKNWASAQIYTLIVNGIDPIAWFKTAEGQEATNFAQKMLS